MERDAAIFVAGHNGLVGSAICRALRKAGYQRLLTSPRAALELEHRAEVDRFFHEKRPDYVFLAAAKVGGIQANATYPAEFLYRNLMVQTNVIDSAYSHGVQKLLFLGSSCIYSREAPQPIREEALLTGPLEPTNEAYAVAKIAGIKLCESYRQQYRFKSICLMPTNLYGPGDNFDLESSHVIPALMRKAHEAKLRGDAEMVIWGTGAPRREFLHVDDLADAGVYLMQRYDGGELVNVGVGEDLSIAELAEMVADVVGYRGALRFDPSKPDGAPRKVLDVSRLNDLGWSARIPLRSGLAATYRWYLENGGALDAA